MLRLKNPNQGRFIFEERDRGRKLFLIRVAGRVDNPQLEFAGGANFERTGHLLFVVRQGLEADRESGLDRK